ncbi:MAG: hypothetical protein J07HB67_01554 [halophilic archaeon J07HB67]|nr:MAG: hypothetical protein J07HB67_01554 [halophilic archaeon J07HB67]
MESPVRRRELYVAVDAADGHVTVRRLRVQRTRRLDHLTAPVGRLDVIERDAACHTLPVGRGGVFDAETRRHGHVEIDPDVSGRLSVVVDADDQRLPVATRRDEPGVCRRGVVGRAGLCDDPHRLLAVCVEGQIAVDRLDTHRRRGVERPSLCLVNVVAPTDRGQKLL